MTIKFLGAVGTVTGSSYVLTSGSGQSILIDLGMFQGLPEIDELNYQPYEFDCSQLSGVVLTHAHLDHCGRLPILLPKGFTGDIWMTPATRDLTELSLYDSANIAKKDKKPYLYDKELVTETIGHFKTVEYRTPFQIGDFTIVMRDAGHILGSASLEIEDAHPEGEMRKIVFSGDLGNSPEPLVAPTELIDTADAVVMESTYGDRLHPELNPVDIFRSEINAIENSKETSTLLIPAFSLDRTQEILHIIRHLKMSGEVSPQTPVFLDSPMSEKATAIYLEYKNIFNAHITEELQHGNPFDFEGLQMILSRQESEAIHKQKGPKVIIAGSGMMTGGRIMGHAAHYLPMQSTRLLIVGYQGEGTIGRQILEGSTQVVIGGVHVPIRANVSSTQAMSSHADQSQLLSWLKHIRGVKKVFLSHGDDVPRAALREKIIGELGIGEVVMPKMGDEMGV